MLLKGYILETVATIASPLRVFTTPLGLRPGPNGALYVKIYPGTKLHVYAQEAVEACLVAACRPETFLDAVEHRLATTPAKTLHTPCPHAEGTRIEAIISARRRMGSALVLVLEPLRVEESCCPGYTRALGCTVEALIAYTRVLYWSRLRRCKEAAAQLEALALALNCVAHVAPNSLLERLNKLARRAAAVAATAGCPAPSSWTLVG